LDALAVCLFCFFFDSASVPPVVSPARERVEKLGQGTPLFAPADVNPS
jgi:hypothetical protein